MPKPVVVAMDTTLKAEWRSEVMKLGYTPCQVSNAAITITLTERMTRIALHSGSRA